MRSGCCDACNGTGMSGDPDTGGKCWDCRSTGCAHTDPCEPGHPRRARYWHGGAPGLKPGDLVTPRSEGDTRHLVDGCPTCEAMRSHDRPGGLARPDRIYVTTEREYARLYAAGYPRGGLYQVEPIGEMEDVTGVDDPVPSWAVTSARVLVVYDALVILSTSQYRRLIRTVTR